MKTIIGIILFIFVLHCCFKILSIRAGQHIQERFHELETPQDKKTPINKFSNKSHSIYI